MTRVVLLPLIAIGQTVVAGTLTPVRVGAPVPVTSLPTQTNELGNILCADPNRPERLFAAVVVDGSPGEPPARVGKGYSHGLAINENSFQFPDHPWKDRERYIRNSPWFFLDRVETPLLLIHGTDDSAAIVTLSNEVFVGLRRLGKTVQYARYVGEGHGLISLQNRIDAGQRFLGWFDRYLKPGQ